VGFDFDVVVVGAGVVGLACARGLAVRGHEVLVLERHERFGVETSSRNSEVVHAGLYYPPGSLKARLCARGNRSLLAYCEARGVPHRRLGKLIVAPTEAEEPKLDQIVATAEAAGVTTLRRLTGAEARQLEPHVRARAALWSPDTGILDTHRFMEALLAEAESHGAAVAYRHALAHADREGGGYRLQAEQPGGEAASVTARRVVNAAGLDADTVAAMAGFDLDACGYRQWYARGHYFRVHPRKLHLARHLIYPTPTTEGLGIHVTLDLAGGVKLGPDVQWLDSREQRYEVPESLRETFHAAVSRYLEGLEPGDLAPDQAGIRPKLHRSDEPPRDFVVAEESERGMPGWVNLIGIESPGLTCALEIAVMAADMLERGG
jgi:L-2-hydroxyglutarate oxidase LhgO